MKPLTELETAVMKKIVRTVFQVAIRIDAPPLFTSVDIVDIHECTGLLIEGTYWKSVLTRLEKKGHITRHGEMIRVVCLSLLDYCQLDDENESEVESGK